MGKHHPNHKANRTMVHHNQHEAELRKVASTKKSRGTHHPHHPAEGKVEEGTGVEEIKVEQIVGAEREVDVISVIRKSVGVKGEMTAPVRNFAVEKLEDGSAKDDPVASLSLAALPGKMLEMLDSHAAPEPLADVDTDLLVRSSQGGVDDVAHYTGKSRVSWREVAVTSTSGRPEENADLCRGRLVVEGAEAATSDARVVVKLPVRVHTYSKVAVSDVADIPASAAARAPLPASTVAPEGSKRHFLFQVAGEELEEELVSDEKDLQVKLDAEAKLLEKLDDSLNRIPARMLRAIESRAAPDVASLSAPAPAPGLQLQSRVSWRGMEVVVPRQVVEQWQSQDSADSAELELADLCEGKFLRGEELGAAAGVQEGAAGPGMEKLGNGDYRKVLRVPVRAHKLVRVEDSGDAKIEQTAKKQKAAKRTVEEEGSVAKQEADLPPHFHFAVSQC